MSRRGQATVVAIALLIPGSALALVGVALLGARVQGERAQRLAEGAALRGALGRTVRTEPDAAVTLIQHGARTEAQIRVPAVSLALPLLGRIAYRVEARAVAHDITTEDGARGAVLVRRGSTTMAGWQSASN